MRNWLGEIDSLLNEVDKNVRGVVRTVRSAFDEGPFEILTYRGFGDSRHAYVYGRAQENRGVGKSTRAIHSSRTSSTRTVAPIVTRSRSRSSPSSSEE